MEAGDGYFVKWAIVAILVTAIAWFFTRRIHSLRERRAIRCLITALVVTPLPLWVPGEGGMIIPAAWALINRSSPWLHYALLGAVPIAIMFGVLYGVSALWDRLFARRMRRSGELPG